MNKLFEATRKVIRESGESRSSITRATGVSKSSLSQFMCGTKGLRYQAIEKILAHLGHEVRVMKRGGKR